MRTVSLRLADLERSTIPIGFQGENLHTQVRIDCKMIYKDYPAAVVSLAVTPPQGDPYPVMVIRDGDIVAWNVTASDTAYHGDGRVQFTFVDGEEVIKTVRGKTSIAESDEPSGTAPTPIQNWLIQAAAALQALPTEVANSVVALMGAMVGVGETLDPDDDVTVSYDAENNTLTIGVPKGKDGDPGHTPAITAQKVGKVVTFYVDGVAVVTVSDGTDGATGTTFTPSVSEEGVISWTNDGGKPNPAPRNIKGDPGKGVVPTFRQSQSDPDRWECDMTFSEVENAVKEGLCVSCHVIYEYVPGAIYDAYLPLMEYRSIAKQIIFAGDITTGDGGFAGSEWKYLMYGYNYIGFESGTVPIKSPVVPVFTRDMTSQTPDIWTCNMTWQEVESAVNNGLCTVCKTVFINPYGQSENYLTFTGVHGDDEESIEFESTLTNDTEIRNTKISFHDTGTVEYTYDYFNVPQIDDNAGTGDTDSTWSANKLAAEKQSLLTEINSKADKTVTDALQKNKAPVIIDSAEGNPIVLTDGADGLPIEGMKIHLLPKQDTSGGDPSPSHVCPIEGWTGLTAWRTGKNLFDFTSYSDWQEGYLKSNGSVSGTSSSPSFDKTTPFIDIVGGETYTFSYIFSESLPSGGSASNNLCFYDENKTFVGSRISANEKTYITATAPENAKFVRVSLRTYAPLAEKYKLELGETASPYAEYTGESYPVTFPDGQTVYGGTLDAVNGVLTVDRAMVTYDGSESWNAYPNFEGYYVVNSAMKKGIRMDGVSNMLKPSFNAASGQKNTMWLGVDSKYIFAIGVYETMGDTLQNFKNYLNANHLEIVYPLATPYEIQLDPVTITTLLGDNTIWSDANGTIELDYRADTKLFIAKNKQDIRATIAPIEDGTTASKAYSAGKFFYHDGNFCKAKTSIASGATFTLNTNYEITTVADELFALN